MFKLFRQKTMMAGVVSGMLIAIVAAGVIAIDSARTSAAPSQTACTTTSRPSVAEGDRGSCVLLAQQRLAAHGYFTAAPTGYFGPITKTAVTNFQRDKGLNPLGYVGTKTWKGLISTPSGQAPAAKKATAPKPQQPQLPASCMTNTKSICVVKLANSRAKVYAVQNKQILKVMDARTGDGTGPHAKTTEGVQKVDWRSRDHKSKEFDGAPMPFALFFDSKKGMAIHYSPTFAPIYNSGASRWGASNGCVNLADYEGAKWLFNWAPNGTRVVVTAAPKS